MSNPGKTVVIMIRRRTCPVCRRACSFWRKLRVLRFAAGELERLVRCLHAEARRGGSWPRSPLRKPIEREELVCLE